MTISSLLRAVLLAGTVLALPAQDWARARPDYRWAFPRDHWAHPDYRTEWWYFTGHLAADGDSAPRFGYQFTIFRIGILPRPPALESNWAAQMMVMGHAAITDAATGRHVFSEVIARGAPMLAGFGAPGDTLIAWHRAPAGTDGAWSLRWHDGAFALTAGDSARSWALDLRTRPGKPLVLQGPNGFSRKGPGEDNASLYYSLTRLPTEGTVRVDGETFRVRGSSWMDKEFFTNLLTREQVGWDWFSVQLDDGRELMLYQLRDASGAATWASGTLVPASGAPRWLAADEFTITPLARWRSDTTGATYPSRWRLTVPSADIAIELEPLVADQENRSRLLRGLYYWEGAVTAQPLGSGAGGRGYVELVGYGRGLRPAL